MQAAIGNNQRRCQTAKICTTKKVPRLRPNLKGLREFDRPIMAFLIYVAVVPRYFALLTSGKLYQIDRCA